MVTGGFYVYHLDNAETGQRPSQAWELGSESVLTGLCGLIAACATWQITWQVAGGMDKVMLTTVINAAVGFVLAWYIPQAAAASRFDPLARHRNGCTRSKPRPRRDRRVRARLVRSVASVSADFAAHRGRPPTLTASSALLTCCKAKGLECMMSRAALTRAARDRARPAFIPGEWALCVRPGGVRPLPNSN